MKIFIGGGKIEMVESKIMIKKQLYMLCYLLIRFENSLDPDQARHLDSKCLTLL